MARDTICHKYFVLIYCAECRFDEDPGGCFEGKSNTLPETFTSLSDALRIGIKEVRKYAPHELGHPIEFEVRDGSERGEVVFNSEHDSELVSGGGRLLDCDELLRRRAHRLEWEVR